MNRAGTRRRPVLVRAAAISGALALLVAAVAGGLPLDGRISVEKRTITLPASGVPVRVTARCAPGAFVFSGGFRFSPAEDLIGGAAPVKAGRWRVRALRSEFEPAPSELTAFALCGKGPIERVRKAEPLPSLGEAREAKATCPTGSVAVGGGGVVADLSSGSFLEGSYPAGDRGWIATGYRAESEHGTTTITAFALCAAGRDVDVVRETTALPPEQVVKRALATCPARTKRIGGGARVDPDEDFLAGSHPAGKRGWAAFGYRDASQLGRSKLTAYAICLPGS